MSDLIPVPDDFEACVQHAIDQDDKARALVERAVERGVERVYLVGCGGSHFGTYPAFDLLDRYAPSIVSQRITSAELTSRAPVGLNEKALVVAASHSGNTPETVAAAEFAKERGALVAGISRQGDNGLSRIGDVHLDYPDTISITEPKLVHNEQIAAALLDAYGAPEKAAQLRAGIPALPGALRAVKDEVAEAGERVADLLSAADAPLSYIVGGGPAYGMAKMMAWCYFQEMSWMNSAAINAGDFFHGPLEMVLEDTTVVTLVAEDASRALGERVVRFAEQQTRNSAAVDTAQFSLPGIPAESRPDLSVLALMSAERRVLDHVAARRGHDTSQRRYMYKIAY
ncbi:SIS domain-containing protein [Agromyces aerolatus]|uniref:SIS domain-containing protein n=1 Tax=Agromyces sp. LY-1074 TaxID=3074080 RepID=UPI002865E0B8|nr:MULTISPECIES: SIS domain-containing protein [unclassified Agromyces]MDR5698771.1 SIS domain-containing protein [Agromyces sp. LY-1074]MDR5705065.1 SIS domain-containing protein [Agromyces sp. LY-1358]